MTVRIVVAGTVFLVVAITIARGIKAAEWLLLHQGANGEWQHRGPVFEHEVACMTALENDGVMVPSGTRLRCERVTAAR